MQKKAKLIQQDNSGLYIIEIFISDEQTITVGKKGDYHFKAGYYYYAGSAQRNLRQRIERHLKNEKPLKWHADYLTTQSTQKRAFPYPVAKRECSLLKKVRRLVRSTTLIKGFGCSDCTCTSHLLYSPTPITILTDLNPR